MALRPEKAMEVIKSEIIADPHNLIATYISDYDDCLLLLLNGDKSDFEQRKHHLNERLSLIDRGDEYSPWHRLCKAGLYMHWAFVHMRFGENFRSATYFRRSYLLLKENKKLFPSFEYNEIFFGIEEATVGAIPDGYKWIASIFSMTGDIRKGSNRLKKFISEHNVNDPFYNEALIYYAYVSYYLLSDKEAAWKLVSGSEFVTDNNLINTFVKANIALNYRKADITISLLNKASSNERYEKYPILDYEYAYAMLYRQSDSSIALFRLFLQQYTGNLFVKDAWQKLSYAYYLKGDMQQAQMCRKQILAHGNAITDADKQALRFAESDEWPDKVLLKAQLLTDGGYYKQASQLMQRSGEDHYNTTVLKLEYYFRMGRINDELGNNDRAIKYYNKAIAIGRDRQEQFAARSALQSGFLYEKLRDTDAALEMYETALSMKKHDFKNSIDQQAKAGINRLTVGRSR